MNSALPLAMELEYEHMLFLIFLPSCVDCFCLWPESSIWDKKSPSGRARGRNLCVGRKEQTVSHKGLRSEYPAGIDRTLQVPDG